MKPAHPVSKLLCDERLFVDLLDATHDAWFFVRADGGICLANRAFGEYFGFEPGDLVGKTLGDVGQGWERAFADPMTYHEVVTHPYEDREGTFLRDVEVTTPQHRFIEVSSVPVSAAGAYAGRLWTMRDVTRDREITDLKIEYGGLRGAEEIKSKFLTVASHQMRTPMSAMRWNLDLLLSGDAGTIPQEAVGLLRETYKSLIYSLSIIDDMLLASDIEQRTLRLDKDSVDITGVIARVLRDFSRIASMRRLTLSFEPPASLPPLFIDAPRMEKVFTRLIDNAIRYTPDGGRIQIEIRPVKEAVEIEVRDNGIGVAEEERPRLFERFYRSKQATSLNPDASGLGLYIARFLVNAHDGTIAYAPAEGGGSVFTVSLPRRAAQ